MQTTEENSFFFLYSAATDGSAEEIAHEALGDPRGKGTRDSQLWIVGGCKHLEELKETAEQNLPGIPAISGSPRCPGLKGDTRANSRE